MSAEKEQKQMEYILSELHIAKMQRYNERAHRINMQMAMINQEMQAHQREFMAFVGLVKEEYDGLDITAKGFSFDETTGRAKING